MYRLIVHSDTALRSIFAPHACYSMHSWHLFIANMPALASIQLIMLAQQMKLHSSCGTARRKMFCSIANGNCRNGLSRPSLQHRDACISSKGLDMEFHCSISAAICCLHWILFCVMHSCLHNCILCHGGQLQLLPHLAWLPISSACVIWTFLAFWPCFAASVTAAYFVRHV